MSEAEERLVEDLIKSMSDRPYVWTETDYVFKNDRGIEIWIANGRDSFGTYRSSIIQIDGKVCREHLWAPYKAWKDRKINCYLNKRWWQL